MMDMSQDGETEEDALILQQWTASSSAYLLRHPTQAVDIQLPWTVVCSRDASASEVGTAR